METYQLALTAKKSLLCIEEVKIDIVTAAFTI